MIILGRNLNEIIQNDFSNENKDEKIQLMNMVRDTLKGTRDP